ncbi:(2Fe-2S)-binding protein [Pseudonocardia acaciae]|uniref:(2Fe-2S)-binding protein n=1 Tax=Pseudonocardia acaciae TaxID=551276 RepID=UPI00048DC2DB|nr:(2Fe-2S)-binding protein [Pseudonocardia acaciae]
MTAERRTVVRATVNGRAVHAEVPVRRTLADFLRDDLGLTGTHLGCEHGVCGACSVLVDGRSVRACLLFAVQVDGHEVTTVEGLGDHGTTARLRDAFGRHHALQCGFCTAGLLVTATEMLDDPDIPKPLTGEAVREILSGNLCRCTGYQGIVRAVLDAGS